MSEMLTFPFTPEVKSILSFIGSRKRKVYTYTRKAGEPETFHSYWDSGSRASYTAFRNGVPLYIPVNGHPIYDASGRDPQSWTPQVGDIVVRHGTTNGKPATPSLTYYK